MNSRKSPLPAPAIDGPWRADPYGAKLVAARNGSGFERIGLMGTASMAVFGDSSDPRIAELLRFLEGWATDQPDSTIWAKKPEELSDLEWLRWLRSYGISYRDLLRERGISWSPNGKYLVAPIRLDPEQLRDPEITQELVGVLEGASRSVVRPLLILEDSKSLEAAISSLVSWQAFIGENEIQHFRDRYPMSTLPGMATRVPIGVALSSDPLESRVLNSMSYEPTAAAAARKNAMLEDARSYELFLEGLNDGN